MVRRLQTKSFFVAMVKPFEVVHLIGPLYEPQAKTESALYGGSVVEIKALSDLISQHQPSDQCRWVEEE